MFLVFNREKVYSYMVAFFTVMVLFFVATTFTREQTIEASANGERKLPIYSVQTEEKEIALTMNCAWNADDIDSILDTLDSYDFKITFFVVGDWVDKYPEAVKKIKERGHEVR